MSTFLPSISSILRVAMGRVRPLRAGLALGLYVWLLAQGFGAFWGSFQSVQVPESETLIAKTAIETPTKQCVHHRVACPPQCHCPPLKSTHPADSHASHDHSDHAHSSESSEGGEERSDLGPGDLAYETCHSSPVEAVTLSGIPAHLRMDGQVLVFPVAMQGFNKSDGLHFENVDPRFPDKVPIFAAI